MEKRKYYVALHSGEIMGELLQSPTEAAYQFEIEATDEEARQLNRLLRADSAADTKTFWDAHIPFLYYNQYGTNEGVDQSNQAIYEMVYQLGTPKTKQQIEALGLLETQKDSDDPEGPVY
ncbi:MAG: hydrolase [Firmicutes bacterium]|uniref:hydrolase n=1 Tax=Melghirimyces thermohalophilus TaxID=1236220 RepID=UPI00115F7BD1|nr:hydrolase [Melghirimyces thermohalophilus]MDA8353049.1 hydrolase [Bacillota bacterium]